MERYAPEGGLLLTYEGLTDDHIGDEVAAELNDFRGKARTSLQLPKLMYLVSGELLRRTYHREVNHSATALPSCKTNLCIRMNYFSSTKWTLIVKLQPRYQTLLVEDVITDGVVSRDIRSASRIGCWLASVFSPCYFVVW